MSKLTKKQVKEELCLAYQKRLVIKAASGRERRDLEDWIHDQLLPVYDRWTSELWKTMIDEGFVEFLRERAQQFYKDSGKIRDVGNIVEATRKLIQNAIDEFGIKPDTGELVSVHNEVLKKAFSFGVASVMEQAKEVRDIEEFDFELTDPQTLQEIQGYAEWTVKQTTDSTLRMGRDHIRNEVFGNGNSIQEVVYEMAGIEKAFGSSSQRVSTIARTNASWGTNYGSFQMGVMSGLRRKKWVTVGDNKVRPQHVRNEAAGFIDIDKLFPNGAVRPGEGPSPWNCRCSLQLYIPPKRELDLWRGGGTEEQIPVVPPPPTGEEETEE